MRLKQTPVGFDFLDTEEILQKLIPSDWSSELRWALWPPVGPRPRASWGKPTWRQGHEEAAVYIIKFEFKATNGDIRTIFKAGITSRSVVGARGRYSKKFGPEVIFEKRLRPAQAWACEQKILQIMHESPFDYTFEAQAKHEGDLEDCVSTLPEGKGNATYFGKDLKAWCDKCDEIRADRDRKREQDGQVIDWDSIVKTKSENLGATEWRAWPYSVESLMAAANQIVDLTIANDAWLEAMLEKTGK